MVPTEPDTPPRPCARPSVDDRPLTRRQVVGVASAAALAGCLGGETEAIPTDGGSARDLAAPVLGDPDAGVTVAVYEDFSCPHCASFNVDVFPDVERDYLDPGTVRYEHHDFPIPVDDWSWPVAGAARAVQDAQGDAAFYAYAKRLFDHQSEYSLDLIAELADAVGAGGSQVREAAADGTYRSVVAADRQAGVERGVSGTPTVFVSDSKLVGPTYDELRAAIESAR